jgi:hypothetical protein
MRKDKKRGSGSPAPRAADSSPFQRFEELFHRVIRVPKEEIDRYVGQRRSRRGERDAGQSPETSEKLRRFSGGRESR